MNKEVMDLTKEMEKRNFNGLNLIDAAAFYIVKRWGVGVGETTLGNSKGQ